MWKGIITSLNGSSHGNTVVVQLDVTRKHCSLATLRLELCIKIKLHFRRIFFYPPGDLKSPDSVQNVYKVLIAHLISSVHYCSVLDGVFMWAAINMAAGAVT